MSLPDPPNIITDIPTTEAYIEGIPGYNHPYTYGTTLGANGLRCLDSLPNGFGIPGYGKGIILCYAGNDDGEIWGGPILRVAYHKPTGKIEDYRTGWTVPPEILIAPGAGNFGEGRVAGVVASQRQGEFSYIFGWGGTEYSEGFATWKMSRGEYVQVVDSEGFYLSDFNPSLHVNAENAQFFVSDDDNPFIWHTWGDIQSNGQGFVTGFQEDGTTFGTERYIGDQSDEDPFSACYGMYTGPGVGYVFTGKTGAFKNKVLSPPGVYAHGPSFAFPWRCGDYGAPELWFLVTEFDTYGKTTGRYKIYRSTWGKGNYVRYDNPAPTKPLGYIYGIAHYTGYEQGYYQPVDPTTFNYHPDRARSFEEIPIQLSDDPAYNLGPNAEGGTMYPKLNPEGYGFELHWYNHAHYVGTIGPFPNGAVYNPLQTPTANAQNSANSAVVNGYSTQSPLNRIYFRVMRDKKRRGVLHMVLGDYGNHPYVDGISFNGIWHATSADDGRTWSRPEQPSPPPHGTNDRVEGKYRVTRGVYSPEGTLTAVRTMEDQTLTGGGTFIQYVNIDGTTPNPLPKDQGAHVSLVALGVEGIGHGRAEENSVYFKRGELTRLTWL